MQARLARMPGKRASRCSWSAGRPASTHGSLALLGCQAIPASNFSTEHLTHSNTYSPYLCLPFLLRLPPRRPYTPIGHASSHATACHSSLQPYRMHSTRKCTTQARTCPYNRTLFSGLPPALPCGDGGALYDIDAEIPPLLTLVDNPPLKRTAAAAAGASAKGHGRFGSSARAATSSNTSSDAPRPSRPLASTKSLRFLLGPRDEEEQAAEAGRPGDTGTAVAKEQGGSSRVLQPSDNEGADGPDGEEEMKEEQEEEEQQLGPRVKVTDAQVGVPGPWLTSQSSPRYPMPQARCARGVQLETERPSHFCQCARHRC